MKVIDYLNLAADTATIVPAIFGIFFLVYRKGLQPLSARRAQSLANNTIITLLEISEMQNNPFYRSLKINSVIMLYVFGSTLLIISMIFSAVSTDIIIQLRVAHAVDRLGTITVATYITIALISEVAGLTGIFVSQRLSFAANDPLKFLTQRINRLSKFASRQKIVNIKLHNTIKILRESFSNVKVTSSERRDALLIAIDKLLVLTNKK